MIHVEELVRRYRGAPRNAVDGTSFEVGAGFLSVGTVVFVRAKRNR
jgi:hypothetical protein